MTARASAVENQVRQRVGDPSGSKAHRVVCEERFMNTRKLKPVTTVAAACVLSLVSAAAFAAGGTRMGGASSTAGAQRTTAPTRMSAPTTTMTTAPTRTAPTTSAPTRTATAKSTTTQRTGQPNASCEDTPNQPGNSMSAPGSAFNPDGKAGTVYAGEQPQNSKNPKSVSQYDVACTRPSH